MHVYGECVCVSMQVCVGVSVQVCTEMCAEIYLCVCIFVHVCTCSQFKQHHMSCSTTHTTIHHVPSKATPDNHGTRKTLLYNCLRENKYSPLYYIMLLQISIYIQKGNIHKGIIQDYSTPRVEQSQMMLYIYISYIYKHKQHRQPHLNRTVLE